MSYYTGQMGDYKTYGYAGDPGFLSSLWRGVKKLAKFIPGPIGTIAGIVGGTAAMGGFKATPPFMPGVGTEVIRAPIPGRYGAWGPRAPGFVAPTTRGMPEYAPGGKCQPGPPGPTRGSVMPTNGCCPVGFHLEKSGRGYCVRNRRMNIANPRALRRGMRRVSGFEKLAKRTISFTRRVKLKK
ncbi:MAG: hypothetical protein V3S55_15655 [Nitrospiraceae bacterium]